MANGEDADLVARNDESVEGQVARATVGDDELTDIDPHAPTEQRMHGQRIDCGLYCRDGVQGGLRVLFAEELKGAFEVRQ